ncbi:TPA: DUF692 domain-containing protein [Klebsiella aerogenes]
MREVRSNSVGIGLRNEHIAALLQEPRRQDIDFLELAPDNWMNIGGQKKESLAEINKKYPLIAHSLSLSIGDALPLNEEYIKNIRCFLDEYHIDIYSDHLCFSRDAQGYLYDLFPLPRYSVVIPYLVERIKRVQDILGRQLILENVSSYYSYANEMPEADFWCELLHLSGCGMLLDINNVYINSFNHGFDALEYIQKIPAKSIVYYHIAGHLEYEELRLDTHGMPVPEDVLMLARKTFLLHGTRPLLLERDNNIPELGVLCEELREVNEYIKHGRGCELTPFSS